MPIQQTGIAVGQVAAVLLRRGYTEQEAEAIMRSKWMLWAADDSQKSYGRIPTSAIGGFLDTSAKISPSRLVADVAQLVRETFPAKPIEGYDFDLSDSESFY